MLKQSKNMKGSLYDDMSGPEKVVAKFLYEHNIWWIYEQPIFVLDTKDRARLWTPDFFLPEVGIYVEVCGSDRDCYLFRKIVYKKNRIPIIFVETFKDNKWAYFLIKRIKEIQVERMKMLDAF